MTRIGRGDLLARNQIEHQHESLLNTNQLPMSHMSYLSMQKISPESIHNFLKYAPTYKWIQPITNTTAEVTTDNYYNFQFVFKWPISGDHSDEAGSPKVPKELFDFLKARCSFCCPTNSNKALKGLNNRYICAIINTHLKLQTLIQQNR